MRLGIGAVRLRAALVLPAMPGTPVAADLVVAAKGRALVRVWRASVGKETAPAAGNALLTAMLERLPRIVTPTTQRRPAPAAPPFPKPRGRLSSLRPGGRQGAPARSR